MQHSRSGAESESGTFGPLGNNKKKKKNIIIYPKTVFTLNTKNLPPLGDWTLAISVPRGVSPVISLYIRRPIVGRQDHRLCVGECPPSYAEPLSNNASARDSAGPYSGPVSALSGLPGFRARLDAGCYYAEKFNSLFQTLIIIVSYFTFYFSSIVTILPLSQPTRQKIIQSPIHHTHRPRKLLSRINQSANPSPPA